MRIFTIVGVVLLILLPVWIVFGLIQDAQLRPQILGVGSGFTAVAGISEQEIENGFAKAKACWEKELDAGDSWHLASEIAAWISFGLTALITLMAGAYGRPFAALEPTPEERAALIEELKSGKTPASRRRGARLVLMVGVLGAAASVLTAAGSKCEVPAQEHYKRAAKIHGVIIQARKTLSSTDTTQREAQDALETMADACISPE